MKSLQQNNLIKAPFDISWLLEKDILRISKILTSRGANLYAVGGSVRASYWKEEFDNIDFAINITCLLYTSPSPRDPKTSRMPSSA